MTDPEKIWIYQLWQTSKWWFVLFVLYVFGILWGIRYQREEFPFLLYGMYSLKEVPQNEYISYEIYVDGKEVSFTHFSDLRRELLTSPLHLMIADDEPDKLSIQQRQQVNDWIYRYIHGKITNGNNSLELYQLVCKYDREGNIRIISKTKINPAHAD